MRGWWMPQIIRLTDDQKSTMIRMVEDDISRDAAERSTFDNRRRHFYNAYRNRVKKKVDPWPGCSNFSLPIITRAIDRTNVHVQSALFPRGLMFPIEATPTTSHPIVDIEKRSKKTSEYLRFNFRNRMKIADPMDRMTRSLLTNGNGFGKLWWKYKERNVRIVERFPSTEFVPEDPENPDSPIVEQDITLETTVLEYFRSKDVVEVTRTASSVWRIRVYDPMEKRVMDHEVEAFLDEDARENVLIIKFRRTVFNQPAFDNVSMDDIHFSMDATNIQEVKRIHLRHFLTLSDFEQGKRIKRWTHLTDEDLDQIRTRTKKEVGTEKEALEQRGLTPIDRPVSQRQDDVEGASERLKKPVEVWESFYSFDIDDDGELEEITIWTDVVNRKIMRVAYTSEDYHTDERPIIHVGLIPVENRILNIGIAEALMPIQVVMNESINSRKDASDLQLRPPTWYRPGSGFFPDTMTMRPGAAFQVDNPAGDVNQLQNTTNPFSAVAIENFLMAFAEDISISASTAGSGGQRQQTARGQLALLQQDQIKMDYVLLRLMPGIEQLCHGTLGLLKLNGPEHDEFRVIGDNTVETIERDDLADRVNFYFDLDSISSNREIRRLYSAQALEGLLELSMMDPQAVSHGARVLGRNFAEALEIRNPSEILPDPSGFDRLPQDQQTENLALARGIPVEPILTDDHQSHLIEMDRVEQEEDWWAQMSTQWVESIWKQHKVKHLQLLQVIQQMQQQATGQRGGVATGGASPFGLAPGTGPGTQNGGGGLQGLGNLAELAAEAPGSTLTSPGG
jgi:hypothetical protein